MTCRSISADDDVRRSLDVLDKVLSEFDDIDSFYNNEHSPPSPDSVSDDCENGNVPPPVDRSIKPRSSPPTLPKKTKRRSTKSSDPTSKHEKCQDSPPVSTSSKSSSNSQRSRVSNHSEASSHEYQEINSVLLGSSRKSGSSRETRWTPNDRESSHQRPRSRGRLARGSSSHEPRHASKHEIFESPLRKSKSGDMSHPSEDNFQGQGNKNGRRSNPRRSRSIDRMIDPRRKQMFDPRLANKGRIDPRDPRLPDPRFFSPQMYDPRFVDPRLVDPLLMDPKFDPRFDPNFDDPRLYDPRMLDRPFFIEDPRRYPLDDPLNFPHLMTLPPGMPGHFSLPPLDPSDYPLPHTVPRYSDYPPIHDPLFNPDLFLGQLPPPPFDPHMRGFDPHLSDFDPALMPPHMMLVDPHDFPMGYPINVPMNYPIEVQSGDFHPRERLDFEGSFGEMNDPRLRGYTHPGEGKWMPPPPEEAKRTIQRLVRNQSYNVGDGIPSREKLDYKPPQRSRSHARRLTSTGHSDSSGTSSPLDEGLRHHADALASFKNSHGANGQLPKSLRNAAVNQASRLGAFQVGEAVRKDGESQKEFVENSTVSLPHFTSGGKDSGFDEIPIVEDHSSLGVRGTNPNGVGGGFVVAGVFSDSSKMYIPAPPSPAPDYDENNGSDDDESDIPQEPFFVCTKEKKDAKDGNKSSSGSNRDSISDDSLLDGKSNRSSEGRRNSKETNSLQALIEEFHMGLPPPLRAEDGSYSDDSLEEESSMVGPSRPSTMDLRSQRPQSMESLISMEGSTTSFDYVSDLHSKYMSSSKTSRLHPLSKSSSLDANMQSSSNQKMNIFEKKPLCNVKSSPTKSYIPSFKSSRERKISSESSSQHAAPSTEVLIESLPSESSCSKFNSVKHLIQEGLIEGLDETPPDFKPPPPPPIKKWESQVSSICEERADSGMGSTGSTNHRADDSVGSDQFSDRSSTTPPKSISESFPAVLSQRRLSSPPPLPPPRDSSIASSNSRAVLLQSSKQQQLNRNQSWLYKNKRPAPQPNFQKDDQSQCSFNNKSEVQKPPSRKPNNVTKNKNKEKITHIDDICPYDDKISNGNVVNQLITTQDAHSGQVDNSEYIKNQINLELRKGLRDNLSVICEDQTSVSSYGSRSGRFFSRLTDSMKSNSRSNSPLAGKPCNKNKDKKNNSSRGNNKFHGDIIRDPNKTQKDTIGPLITPPEFQHSPSSMIPLTRDGSGRFRSIEDLAEAASGRNKNEFDPMGGDDSNRRKKKHSTLPPNLSPSDMEEQARDNTRNRDETEGSKFKLNIFKGFWRRNKYSFDKF